MLLLSLLLIFLSERTAKMFTDLGFDISIPRIIIFSVSILLLYLLLIKKTRLNRSTLANKVGGCLIIFSLLSLVSSSLTPDAIYSLKRWLHFLSLCLPIILICFFLPKSKWNQPNHSLKVHSTVLSSVKLSIIILFVFFIYQQLTHDFLDRNEYRTLFGIEFYRINSLFPDPNFLGVFLSFCAPFFTPAKLSQLRRKRNLLYLVLIIYMLIFSGSRGGILAAAAGALFKILLSSQNFNFTKKSILYSATFIPIILLSYSFFGFSDLVEGLYKHDDESLSGLSRAISWYAGLNAFIQNPLLGIGPGNFVTLDKSSFIASGVIEDWRLKNLEGLAAHSNYLEILTSTGSLGFISWLLFNVYLTKLIATQSKAFDYSIPLGSAILSFNIACALVSYFPVWYFLSIAIYILTIMRPARTGST
ncbi:O-Antigen ligase [compost metagenome]|jgi:O-antigen ligase